MTRIVVIGGGPGGTAAATNAIQKDRSASVTLITDFEDIAYSPCGIPYAFGREVPTFESLFLQNADFYAKMGLDLRTSTTVTRIDAQEKVVFTDNGQFPYDKLVIATGWGYEVPAVPGAGLKGIWYLKNIRRAMEIDPTLDQCKSALVYKGKPLATEMAFALTHRGIQVHVVDEYPWLCADFVDPEIMKPMQDALEKMGVQFHLGQHLEEIKGTNGKVSSFRTGDGEFPCDVVFVTGPVKPNTDLARSIGVKCGSTGGVVVDDHMRTNVPDVYAVGGCVEIMHGCLNIPIHILPSTFAYPQGRIAGINAVGGNLAYYPVFGPWGMIVGNVQASGVTICETMAKALGLPYFIGQATGLTAARYHPASEKLFVKLIADTKTHRLIGAEMVGGEGAKERA
ncbi:MAG TPA: FAD-dependent oxidoreductase, partial [Chloroflexota bacterium]|nr:FAD-dependent oxidoreductase [Chloroflexota bacterium]